MFSLVFRGFGGDEMIEHFLGGLPGGLYGFIIVMLAIFLLGIFFRLYRNNICNSSISWSNFNSQWS
jgi:TRAP-type mannitol/chloroaromatic compound transport system permease large subunit